MLSTIVFGCMIVDANWMRIMASSSSKTNRNVREKFPMTRQASEGRIARATPLSAFHLDA
jgi:hypothetical protein